MLAKYCTVNVIKYDPAGAATVRFLAVAGVVQARVGQIVTFFETAALAAPWAP